MADSNIRCFRRINSSGNYYFISNQGTKPFDGWLRLQAGASSAALFNPMTGEYGLAKSRASKEGSIEIYTRLVPGQSMIVSTSGSQFQGKSYSFYDPVSAPQEITGKWKIDFIEGGPVLPASKETDMLVSWTEFGGEDVKNFSGTASYKISFSIPSVRSDALVINLGKVCESARVFINGTEAGILTGPDYRITIGKNQLRKLNTLEVRVSNLMANRIAYLDRNNIAWKKFYNINFAARLRENSKNGIFDASSWSPRESGLIGPVTITPVNILK